MDWADPTVWGVMVGAFSATVAMALGIASQVQRWQDRKGRKKDRAVELADRAHVAIAQTLSALEKTVEGDGPPILYREVAKALDFWRDVASQVGSGELREVDSLRAFVAELEGQLQQEVVLIYRILESVPMQTSLETRRG